MAEAQTIGTVNEEGTNVDLYIPRKCHASNRLVTAYDHGAVQIAIGDVDETGAYTCTSRILVLSGEIRKQGNADWHLNHLLIGAGVLRGRSGRQNKKLKKRQAASRAKFGKKKKVMTKGKGNQKGQPRRGGAGGGAQASRGGRASGGRGSSSRGGEGRGRASGNSRGGEGRGRASGNRPEGRGRGAPRGGGDAPRGRGSNPRPAAKNPVSVAIEADQ